MYYIGIDLGTSAVKLLLMKEDGTVVKIVSKEYPLSFPNPGWSEQNPSDWWEQSVAGLKELTTDVDRNEIGGISFGGQMHGLVILDENDEVIRPAILWNDGRTVKETEYLNTVVGKETLSKYTGNIAFAGFTAPKILWVHDNEPQNFARIHKLMLPKDYLAYKLTGVLSSDYSDASGMLLLDVEHKCWSKEMMEICHVKEEWLPKLFESYEKTGTLKPEVAKLLGFPENCIVAAGAGDNAAAAVGTGAVGGGKCNLSLGTSGTMFITSENYSVDPNNALHSFAHADGKYHLMGCMLSAASCNKWWMEEILKTTDFVKEQEDIVVHEDFNADTNPDSSDAKVRKSILGENHVYFLPYLMGERSPHNDPMARGTFVGMRLDTTRTDMLQAVFEGVAYGLRDSLEVARNSGVAPARTTICGGGAKSPLWRTIVANVMNMEVDTVEVEEGPAYGGAILAAVANGEFASVEEAAGKIVRKKDPTLPTPELVEKYEAGYQKFKQIYPALKSVYQKLI